jgi:hypothetical protein
VGTKLHQLVPQFIGKDVFLLFQLAAPVLGALLVDPLAGNIDKQLVFF